MTLNIRPFEDADEAQVIDLTLRAFVPIFESFEQVMGPNIFPLVYPDWRQGQRETAVDVMTNREKFTLLIAEVDGQIAGYLAYTLDHKSQEGEIYLLAVDPNFQNDGVGTALNLEALARFRKAGMRLAVVGTGGDEGHAPARRSYEKAGFRALPLVRYYQDL